MTINEIKTIQKTGTSHDVIDAIIKFLEVGETAEAPKKKTVKKA